MTRSHTRSCCLVGSRSSSRWACCPTPRLESARNPPVAIEDHPDQVLEWNQIFIDTLIATVDGEFVQSAARRHRPHGDIRRLQRDRAPVHTGLRSRRKRPAAHRGGRLW